MLQIIQHKLKNHTQELGNYVKISMHSAQQMFRTIKQYIDLSKLDEGLLVVTHKKFNIMKLLKDVFKLQKFLAKSKGLDFKLELQQSLINMNEVAFVNDNCKIMQILNILIENAIKYTKKGSVIISFRIEQASDDPCSTIGIVEIRDTGYGIDEDKQSQIFKFFGNIKFKDNVNMGGGGTGLCFAKQLSDLIGCQISFTSIKNIGTTFKLQIKSDECVNSILKPHNDRDLTIKNISYFLQRKDSKFL